jgi:hypothetical protein
MDSERIILGKRFISGVISEIVSRVVETAIEVYALNTQQAAALRKAFSEKHLFEIVPV